MPPGFGERMQVDDGASEHSSSSISSPPTSPHYNSLLDTIHVAHPPATAALPQLSGGGVANNAHSAHPARSANTAAYAQNSNASAANTPAPAQINGAAPEKVKRQRKKKEVGPDGKAIDDGKPKEKKPRKPREPKDKTAASTTTTAPRRKPKPDDKPATHDAPITSRQPTITDMVNGYQTTVPTTTMPMPAKPQHSTSAESIHHRNSLGLPTSGPPTPRPISSGQNYDPVRGYDPVRAATMETAQSRSIHTSNGTPSLHTSPRINRASASPSIASLIDPPMNAKTSAPVRSFSPPNPIQQPYTSAAPQSHAPFTQTASITESKSLPSYPVVTLDQPSAVDGAMDIDLTCDAPKAVASTTAEVDAPSKASSASAPTPKASARPTPPPVPKAKGSGLLSTSSLLGGPSPGESSERKGVNIDLHIPLNPQGGNTINIALEIFKKYGRDAINPRAAAHRAQLLQIQAAANKIDGGSTDDMSGDLMSDIGDDSNVEMGGMYDEPADGDAKPRKRRKKVEEYDKEDDFIDDTELAWQEQAAVAKDGFFVYSGPLVPEGQAAQVESASTVSTRGGRGRGRGRGRATATTGTTHASLTAEKSRDPGAPSTRARGRGRGTGAPRKPRITKADRERMEAEKADRERVAGQIGGPVALAPTPTPQPPQSTYQQQPMGTIV